MKEYKLPKGWIIFICIIIPPMMVLFVWLALMPFLSPFEGMSPDTGWFFVPVSLVMIVVMGLMMVDAIIGKVIIDGNKIIKRSIWGTRELNFHEIKGFTVTQQQIIIQPNVKHKKTLKISMALAKKQEIITWLAYDHPDLDEVNSEREALEIIANEQYGDTRAERTLQLEKAKQVAKYLNFAGIAIGAWAFLYPYPYGYMLIACLIAPVITVVVMMRSKGLIRLDERKGSMYPSVISGFAGPVLGLIWRGLNDYNIFDHANSWIPTTLIAAGLTGLLIMAQKDFLLKEVRHRWLLFTFLLFGFGYGYGAVITLNCYYDRATPEEYVATVVKKNMGGGTHTSYYLYLSPWGKVTEVEDVDVPRELYNSLQQDDRVKISLRQGLFNIPWLRITK